MYIGEDGKPISKKRAMEIYDEEYGEGAAAKKLGEDRDLKSEKFEKKTDLWFVNTIIWYCYLFEVNSMSMELQIIGYLYNGRKENCFLKLFIQNLTTFDFQIIHIFAG